jgi:hypothetical protein
MPMCMVSLVNCCFVQGECIDSSVKVLIVCYTV